MDISRPFVRSRSRRAPNPSYSKLILLGFYHCIPTVLTLDDIRHLNAADSWLERGDFVNCFHELEQIDFNNREDQRVFALRWKLYNKSKQHVPAANLALGIQQRFPDEPAGYVWRAISPLPHYPTPSRLSI